MNHPAYFDALRAIARPIRAVDWPRSLNPVRRLLAELGDPHHSFQSVVVTGSVGKGTICHQIAAGIDAPGIGLYTSPHLHSFRERFVIDGNMISQTEFIEGVHILMAAVERTGERYSTFELATALAFWWFAHQRISLAILEVSIGGRWDAVNVVDNVLACFTPIEQEHAAMLGGSLQTIAWVKAGIMRPGGIALSAHQSPDVEAVLRHEANLKGTELTLVESSEMVLATHHFLGSTGIIPASAFKTVPPSVQLPGRLEMVTLPGKTVLIDGGHTLLAAKRLRQCMDEIAGSGEPVRLIVGMLGDKSAAEFLGQFDRPLTTIVFTQPPANRAFTASDLATQVSLQNVNTEIAPSLENALRQIHTTREKLIVITGSLRMAAAAREALGLLSPAELAESTQTRTIFDGVEYLRKLS